MSRAEVVNYYAVLGLNPEDEASCSESNINRACDYSAPIF